MKYKRVLLKVSGEALSGKTPIDFERPRKPHCKLKRFMMRAVCSVLLSAAATFGADAPAEQWIEAAPIT